MIMPFIGISMVDWHRGYLFVALGESHVHDTVRKSEVEQGINLFYRAQGATRTKIKDGIKFRTPWTHSKRE
jgi:hypothetical protein